MAVLIDPARWPAHGTVFAHLVSDASLAELHEFAERAGLNPRAFDRDHYDVSEARREELIALGAEPVAGSELIRRLRSSGLRVTSRERPEHARFVLRARWPQALAGAVAVRDDLLVRWSQPHRHYHDVTHLLAVLDALAALAAGTPQGSTAVGSAAVGSTAVGSAELGPTPLVVTLAAWFHDAVYDGVPGADEEASAVLAEQSLAGHLDEPEVAEVARLVRLTVDHRPPAGDLDGALLSDADLAVLGSEPARYDRYVGAVRQDYAHVSDHDWRSGRAAVLRLLLALDPLYRTARGRDLWHVRAQANLRRELKDLLA